MTCVSENSFENNKNKLKNKNEELKENYRITDHGVTEKFDQCKLLNSEEKKIF